MARLGGMSTESFSSARERLSAASVGLGSILRDQKAMPGSNRMNVLLGLSSQTSPAASRSLLNSPVHSLASSPIESNGFLDVDDTELKDEDIWGLDMSVESGSTHFLDPLHRHRLPHAYVIEVGSMHTHNSTVSYHSYSPTHTHSQKHGVSHVHLDAPKQRMHAVIDGMRPAQHHLVMDKSFGLTDAISTNAGSVRLSPLSKVSESQPLSSHAHQIATPSRSIPRVDKYTLHNSSMRAEHQSAPVNVPNWSEIMRKDTALTNMTNFDRIKETGEDEEERLPPHVILAKEHERSQRMTSSVCEGQGRTLKGRDMRRVRNAVWRQTGFID